MENRFGIKDFFLFLLVVVLIVSVWLSMKQNDRQFAVLQRIDDGLRDQTTNLAQLQRIIQSGGFATAGAATRPSLSTADIPIFKYLREAEQKPDYATGDWSVTMHGTSAKGGFTIMFGTETHVAYTFPGMKQAPGNTASNWLVSGRTMAGMLTVAVHGRDMTYTIEPYHYDGLSCDRAIFPGYVDRD